jgi:hypothetical protein
MCKNGEYIVVDFVCAKCHHVGILHNLTDIRWNASASFGLHVASVRGHPSVFLLPLSSPTLPLFICTLSPHLCIISRDYTQRPTTFALIVRQPCRSRLLDVVDFPTPYLLIPLPHRTSLRRIGTGPCDTMAPSTITWTPIFGRLGTRRLGTAL